MNALEFDSRLAASDKIEIPPDVASQLPAGANVRVIVMWETAEEEEAEWRRFSMDRFASHYAPEDAIYEKLNERPSNSVRLFW